MLSKDNFVNSLLPIVITLMVNQALFYIIPWKLVKTKENGYKYSYHLRRSGAFSDILLCWCKDGENSDTIYAFVCMMNFDLVFMTQGIIDQTYRSEQEKLFDELKDTMLAPFSFFAFFMMYQASCPTPPKRTG